MGKIGKSVVDGARATIISRGGFGMGFSARDPELFENFFFLGPGYPGKKPPLIIRPLTPIFDMATHPWIWVRE